MKKMFAPGCALVLYKPDLAERIHNMLNQNLEPMDRLLTCCKNEPVLEPGTEVINICPGCDKRYRLNYETSSTISLWEILAQCDWFEFPDYKGQAMSIIDACPTRDQERVHDAVRRLAEWMNIRIIEPEKTRTKSTCCGDTFYGELPTEKVREQMKKRTAEMPVDDVIVYCVSCTKSVFIGGKRPHYLVDLLFGEPTLPQTLDPDEWHAELEAFIEAH